jgi:hypothetical protein
MWIIACRQTRTAVSGRHHRLLTSQRAVCSVTPLNWNIFIAAVIGELFDTITGCCRVKIAQVIQAREQEIVGLLHSDPLNAWLKNIRNVDNNAALLINVIEVGAV